MKKITLIALFSFIAGLFVAAYIFVYQPEKDDTALNTEAAFSSSSSSSSSSSEIASNLYASPPQQPKINLDFAAVAERVSPAVVSIKATKIEKISTSGPFDEFWERFFDIPEGREQERQSTASGTGFFISTDGYILTNNHIVEKASKVTITTLEEKQFRAEIVGLDPETDLALLKVDQRNQPFVRLGDSERLKVGEWVLAIGNPLGFTHTVTAGIVSAKGRLLYLPDQPYQDFIQTDAAINRGNSGGPLVNMEGEVIGINSMIWTPTGVNIGIGFAISSKLAKDIVEQLKENGRVIRGWIGISILAVTKDMEKVLKTDSGALINDVTRGLPAEKAGLKRWDVIVSIDGEPVTSNQDLMFKIAGTKPGTKVDFGIIRDGEPKTIEVKIGEKEPAKEVETSTASDKKIGLTVQELTTDLAEEYSFQTKEGLIITKVDKYSEAEKVGLEPGDIILEANRKLLKKTKDLEKIIKATDPGDAILLLIRREDRRRGTSRDYIITLRIPE